MDINFLSDMNLDLLSDGNQILFYKLQVSENVGQKGKLYCRRATSFIQTEQLENALADLNEAVRLLPQDKVLQDQFD